MDAGVYRWIEVCTGGWKCAQVDRGVHRWTEVCAQVDGGVHR